ncbi:hypothetical protein WJX75_004479 [Coccomyxa subellipsoidea]|uniref:Uncharacterized protein n=1 Tax=Coccomyxa subellipsoidea TaxID=248742 RepID=A0ABR2YHN5_9CHLO
MRDHVGEARAPLLGTPGKQLRIALGLSPSPPRTPSQPHSPRAVSSTIFRTCAAIAGLVILNAILGAVILSAVHSFSGSSNKPVQLRAANGLHSASAGYSFFVRTEPVADNALAPPAAALYTVLVKASAVAASPAPAADSSEAAEPAWMHRVVAGGKLFVSEATLTWEQLAETSVEEAQDAVQQDRVIEQEKASSDGSEVEAFGEVYSAGDVAGVSLDPADNPPALAPAPAPEHAPDPCAAALGVPKVAIMFLSKAELFHESSWALWFQHAAGLLPVSSLREDPAGDGDGDAGCDGGRVLLAQQWCSAGAQGNGVLQRQHLFSVYIHPLPDYGTFPEESIFWGREIEDRIQASMLAAVRDPLNQKFVLLSESGIPLYPPTAVYAQLMAEDKSRIDSCGIGRTDPWRFSGRMGWALREHWRKSSQWFALSRKHVQIILDDTHILDLFQHYCQSAWDNDLNRWRDCFSDEHYMPSLLAYKQLGHETDCVGRLVGVDWSQGGAHPKSYTVQDINPDKMVSLRLWGERCDDQEAIRSSAGQFVHEAEVQNLGSGPEACLLPAYNGSALGYDCPLFARKFPRETASAMCDCLHLNRSA